MAFLAVGRASLCPCLTWDPVLIFVSRQFGKRAITSWWYLDTPVSCDSKWLHVGLNFMFTLVELCPHLYFSVRIF